MTFVDLCRVIVSVYGAVSLLLAVFSYRYFLRRNPPRLLKHHVASVTAVYVAIVVYGVVEFAGRYGSHATWRLGGLALIFAFGLYAQTNLYLYEKSLPPHSWVRHEEEGGG